MSIPDSASNMSTDILKSSSIIADVEQILNNEDDKKGECISIFEVLRMYQISKNNFKLFQAITEQHSYGVQSTNSAFSVNISNTCIYVYRGNKHITSDFKIIVFCNENNEIFVKCKCNDVLKMLKTHEEKLFRRIFVKISDCPEWMHDELKKERNKEIKIQKRRELLTKIFPFIK